MKRNMVVNLVQVIVVMAVMITAAQFLTDHHGNVIGMVLHHLVLGIIEGIEVGHPSILVELTGRVDLGPHRQAGAVMAH